MKTFIEITQDYGIMVIAMLDVVVLLYFIGWLAEWFKIHNYRKDCFAHVPTENTPKYIHLETGEVLHPWFKTKNQFMFTVGKPNDKQNMVSFSRKEFINHIVKVQDYA